MCAVDLIVCRLHSSEWWDHWRPNHRIILCWLVGWLVPLDLVLEDATFSLHDLLGENGKVSTSSVGVCLFRPVRDGVHPKRTSRWEYALLLAALLLRHVGEVLVCTGSIDLLLQQVGPSFLISAQARRPAEFKHINKRRKRN